MIAAFSTSTLFLVFYLVYHAQVGSVPFTRQGFVRPLYFSILITHVTLAAAVLPLALVTLSRGLQGSLSETSRHRPVDAADLALCLGHAACWSTCSCISRPGFCSPDLHAILGQSDTPIRRCSWGFAMRQRSLRPRPAFVAVLSAVLTRPARERGGRPARARRRRGQGRQGRADQGRHDHRGEREHRQQLHRHNGRQGRFTIIGLRAGSWRFIAQAPGFAPEGGQMAVRTGSPEPAHHVRAEADRTRLDGRDGRHRGQGHSERSRGRRRVLQPEEVGRGDRRVPRHRRAGRRR